MEVSLSLIPNGIGGKMTQDAWEDWTKNWNNAKKFFDSKGNIKTKAKLKKKWHDDFMEIFKAHNKIVEALKKHIQQCKQDVIDIIEKELLGEITFSEKGYKLWLGIKSKINNKGEK